MRTTSVFAATAATLLLSCPALGGGTEPYEDTAGDATGASPDIVSVQVDEPEGESTVRFAVEFAQDPPLGTDMETWSDVVFLLMAADDTVDERGILAGDVYTTGTHGVTLEPMLDSGALLVTPDTMLWRVVDLAVDGPVLSFTLDRQLLGDPLELHWQLLVGVERDQPVGDEGDLYPDEGEPPALYRLGQSQA